MADIGDLEERMAEHRKWVTETPSAMGIRMYDGICELLIEVIRELREIKEQGKSSDA